jgi:OmpA-OmpF porin, OOP family
MSNNLDDASKHAASVPHHGEEINEASDSGLPWLLAFFLLALIAAAAWYFLGVDSNKHEEVSTTHGSGTIAKEDMHEATAVVTGTVDSSGNFIYELGKMVTIDLPNKAGSLIVGENSTENKLYKFLIDPIAVIDTVKGNWFEFTNVRFATGGSKVDSLSSAQLKNIVAISKGYPSASFKVGGYTDNTGDSLSNVALSQKRSEAVVAALLKLGASSASITGAKGYGPLHPIGDNSTEEGRAMNRRVAINVKSK